jgi:hypothetical protein
MNKAIITLVGLLAFTVAGTAITIKGHEPRKPTCDFIKRQSRAAEIERIRSQNLRCSVISLQMTIDGVRYSDTESWRLTVQQYEDDYDSRRKGGLFDFEKK